MRKLEEKLKLYIDGRVEEAVASQKSILDKKIQEYQTLIDQAEHKFETAQAELQETRENIHRTGLMPWDHQKPSDFAGFLNLAQRVSDDSYRVILSRFVQQAGELGYNDVSLGEFNIRDHDTGFSISTMYIPVKQENGKLTRDGRAFSQDKINKIKTSDLNSTYQSCDESGREKLIIPIDESSAVLINVFGSGREWQNKLEQDLSLILDAYFIGTALKNMQGNTYAIKQGAKIMKMHGLEKYQPLLDELAQDGNMNALVAESIVSAYKQ